MARGRPRKSDQQKALEGNPGKGALGGEPAAKGKPQTPRGLNADGKWLAKIVVQSWMGEIDSAEFRVLCETWQLLRATYKIVKANPADRDARIAYLGYASLFDKIAAKFGMSPSDRAKIRLPMDQGGDDDEKEYFGVVG